MKPTHTRLTYTRMRPHAPSHQAGDHPVPAHTERHNPSKVRTQQQPGLPPRAVSSQGQRQRCRWPCDQAESKVSGAARRGRRVVVRQPCSHFSSSYNRDNMHVSCLLCSSAVPGVWSFLRVTIEITGKPGGKSATSTWRMNTSLPKEKHGYHLLAPDMGIMHTPLAQECNTPECTTLEILRAAPHRPALCKGCPDDRPSFRICLRLYRFNNEQTVPVCDSLRQPCVGLPIVCQPL